MRILGQLSCYVCGDTWFRDMDDMEIAAYMAEHPEVDLSSLTDIDLGETLCDGCEDFYNDEYELAEDEEIEAQHTSKNSKKMPVPLLAPVNLLFGISILPIFESFVCESQIKRYGVAHR